MDDDDLAEHYEDVVSEIAEGRVVPLLGAGANRCGRAPDAVWDRAATPLTFLPDGGELASFLATYSSYPRADTTDLLSVAQWFSVKKGVEALYEELREIFDVDYAPSPLHVFLARLPAALKAKGVDRAYQLILTTNYDDMLERAFRTENEPFDVVSYIADGEHRGKFVHRPHDGPSQVIETPNEYKLSLAQRTVIVKVHGAVNRSGSGADDSYVITEDDYIDYLTRSDIASLLPMPLQAQMKRCHFLFLGYGLRDWNLRVILHRIWGAQRRSAPSWAVQWQPDRVERTSWKKRNVEIYDVKLEDYVRGLAAQLELPFKAGIV